MSKACPIRYYFNAKLHVYESGYYFESYTQEIADLKDVKKSTFYKEYAWVVLSSGMNEKVVRILFEKITPLFNNWKNPALIIQNQRKIYNRALAILNYPSKVSALIEMAYFLCKKSIAEIVNRMQNDGVTFLRQFKFLGPATSFHLAKNLGVDLAKPDRHLTRIAHLFGYTCTNLFCQTIAAFTHEKKSVIDVVLWRYATLNKSYLNLNNA